MLKKLPKLPFNRNLSKRFLFAILFRWFFNSLLGFTTTPTANNLKIMVSLEDEKKAFEIIDAWRQKSDNV